MVAKKICTISNRSILIRVSEKGKKVILKAVIRKKKLHIYNFPHIRNFEI